jgi:hypothetical protein
MKNLLFFCALALFSVPAPSWAQTKETVDARYGVIEVGSSGVKAIAIEKLKEDPKAKSEDPPTKVIREYKVENPEAYKGGTDGVATTVGAEVSKFARKMSEEDGVPQDHIYVVGSSGIPKDVQKTIGNNIEDRSIEYIDVERETMLTFKGIVPPWRLNLNEVVLLDIGSGNSKGTYLTERKPALKFVTFSIPLGAKTLAQELDKKPEQAKELIQESVVAPVKAASQQYEGMRKCSRLYIAGGVPWAMAVLSHPERFGKDKNGRESNWVQLTPADIEKFCETATTVPASLFDVDLSGVRLDNLDRVKKDIDDIRGIFSLNGKKVKEENLGKDQLDLKALKAGSTILETFVEHMNYKQADAKYKKKAAIFFSKRALFAWPHGYVLEKAVAKKATASR